MLISIQHERKCSIHILFFIIPIEPLIITIKNFRRKINKFSVPQQNFVPWRKEKFLFFSLWFLMLKCVFLVYHALMVFFTYLLMVSYHISALFDQYFVCKMDKQWVDLPFHFCSCCFALLLLLLESLTMESNNCFWWHVPLIFHLLPLHFHCLMFFVAVALLLLVVVVLEPHCSA